MSEQKGTLRRRAWLCVWLGPLVMLAHACIGAWRGLCDGAAELSEAWEIINGRQ